MRPLPISWRCRRPLRRVRRRSTRRGRPTEHGRPRRVRRRKDTVETKGLGARRDPSPGTEPIIVHGCGDTTIRRSVLGGDVAGGRGASGGRTPRPTSPQSVKALSWLSVGDVAGRIPGCPVPLPGRSRGKPIEAGRDSGRAGGGIAGIRRGLLQRIRVLSTGARTRSVRWPHGSGQRRREPWGLGGSVGGSPTVVRAGRAAVYAASAFRVVMDRMVSHPAITGHPAACLESLVGPCRIRTCDRRIRG
ncbi:hypothetical protein Aros01_04284 [Streptosporangium roseum]|uniref:Uncharacterized protein n=1 Tax=Streptosporangium roseum (strain ATCC 12428 / DSM 43021 / JCM 3005 / KCTC 9067 / NCIMB 10171 / NRRL 2505 / NI 9100) TaxID=479432 RepID=D2BE54_STRRD|nr:hypothetical protein Sros_7417 [Streptosporangium roseum DSM 43021]